MKNIITKFASGSGLPSMLPEEVNKENAGSVTDTVIAVINGVIAILATVAVVIVIIGGVNYMTSSGEAEKVKKAKNTILYGLIGLVICVLAFAIVNFFVVNMFMAR